MTTDYWIPQYDDEGQMLQPPPEFCVTCFHKRLAHSHLGGRSNYYCLHPGCLCQDDTANAPNGLCDVCMRPMDALGHYWERDEFCCNAVTGE